MWWVLAGCAKPMVAEEAVDRAWAPAVQGDVVTALRRFDHLPPDPADQARRCVVDRFRSGAAAEVDTEDPLVRAVVEAYRAYWTAMFLGRGTRAEGERLLFDGIGAALTANGLPAAGSTLEDRADALGPVLEARGYHSIRGVTSPYWELMVWRSEDRRHYDVELPETRTAVDVVLLDGWVSRGWTAWATCERSMSGGWTGDRELYCMADAYDLDSETFRVSYLAHESQHFVDRAAWPDLDQPELEYRAKLTELILADATGPELLAGFAANTSPDRSVPHSFANGWVAHDVDPADLRASALAALTRSSARLHELGPTANRFLPDRP